MSSDYKSGARPIKSRPDLRKSRRLSLIGADIDETARTPKTRLDLHNFTLAEAYLQFVSLVREAADHGVRQLEVVTGQGSPEKGTGSIRAEFPMWCGRFSPPILSVVPKGLGAFVVRLKKRS